MSGRISRLELLGLDGPPTYAQSRWFMTDDELQRLADLARRQGERLEAEANRIGSELGERRGGATTRSGVHQACRRRRRARPRTPNRAMTEEAGGSVPIGAGFCGPSRAALHRLRAGGKALRVWSAMHRQACRFGRPSSSLSEAVSSPFLCGLHTNEAPSFARGTPRPRLQPRDPRDQPPARAGQ